MTESVTFIYMADLDRYLEKRGIGDIKLGKERIWSLAYTDDLMLAKNKKVLILGT